MTAHLRTLHIEEFDAFMRFMERAYGHSREFFSRYYGHLYRPTPEACANCYVIEEAGRIVSHVGLFPIHVVSAGVRLTLGGIGGVATLPEARGRGYMTRLLNHAIGEMRARGYPASWLGGDRQRYNTFGWEMAAPVFRLTFSRRSLAWHDVTPTPIEEVLPEAAYPLVAAHQHQATCHARRPDLREKLQRRDLRFWVAADGYAIAEGQQRDHVKVVELVSASGDEAGLLQAILEWNFAEDVTWELSAWEHARLARVMPYTAGWQMRAHGMIRINDLTALLSAALPFLTPRAVGLRDTAVTLRLRERDRTTATTLIVKNETVRILAGAHTPSTCEFPLLDAVRLLFGGPAPAGLDALPPPIRALFPLPLYVPHLDRV
ncbi:MAG: GNAT family N-acetyltransferase [Anaerolineae bacterium]